MKFTKSEVKKSLRDGISLMTDTNGNMLWATFDEINLFRRADYELVNDKKKTFYERLAVNKK